jgi:2-phosphosulfolactate phosphatase
MMKIIRATPNTYPRSVEMAVIIDVLRAFTSACYAFQAGAESILICGTIEEAFLLRKRFPKALLMGEVNGIPIPEFDLPNSPSTIEKMDLSGKQLILRTTAGSQSVLRWKDSSLMGAVSLCNVTATMNWISRKSPAEVVIVASGVFNDGWGDEDLACGDLLEELLNEREPDIPLVIQRVRASKSGHHYEDANNQVFPPHDLDLATRIDQFDFALPIRREGDLLIMRKELILLKEKKTSK